ncbi:MAG: PTS sucrose transporter subunit IIBC [Ktedonobacteraceae bacterium]|nr:PTS sucrose transporter subunit IIBC [Ktedonobacteraceae bacterium]
MSIIDSQGIFIGDIFGFILALPISLFLVYWLSSVKNRMAVVFGAFLFALIGFIIILGWAGTLIFDTPLPGANGGAAFFGSLLLCMIMGLIGGIVMDLIVARTSRRSTPPQEGVHG